VDTWRGRIRFYTWDLDLEGRTETDARARLIQLVGNAFGIAPAGCRQRRARPIRFPGLTTIFLSYRRADNDTGLVTRLYRTLAARLPEVRHFLDVEDEDPEVHVPTRLRAAISNSPVLVALIGRRWLGEKQSSGRAKAAQSARIWEEADFVRLEIREAITQSIPIVTVALAGASMPAREQLPPDIRPMLAGGRLRLTEAGFEAGIDPIAAAVSRARFRRPAWSVGGTKYEDEPAFGP
jgi:hypothetical protein